MAYLVVGPDGKEHGPLELATLAEWVRGGSLPPDAPVRDLASGTTTPAGQMPELRAHYASFDYSRPPGPATGAGSASVATSLIPTGNPDALWGYYLGFVSLLCCVGLPATPFAIIKARKGLERFKQDPSVHGRTHAIVGLVLAIVGGVGNLVLVGTLVYGLLSRP